MDFDFTTETITPDSTTLLTIGGTGALELPSGTTGQQPGTAVAGALRWNTSSTWVEYYNGTIWAPFTTPSTSVTTFQTSLSGLTPSTATSGAVTLAGTLGATSGGTGSSSAPTSGQVLYSSAGTTYAPTTLSTLAVTSLSGTSGNITVSAATGSVTINLATAGTAGTYGSVTTDTFGRVTSGSVIAGFANGGTNAALTASAGSIIYNNGTSLANSTVGTSGYYLTSGGAGAPTWSNPATSLVTSFQTSLSGLTPSTATTGVVTLAGTLGLSSGGTGASLTDVPGGIVYGGATVMAFTAAGTTNQILQSNGAGTPTWTGAPTVSGANITSGTIPNGALANSSITIGTTTISLGGTSTTLGGMTGITLVSGTVTGVATPVAQSDVVPLSYLQQVLSGLEWKAPAQAATTPALGNIAGTYANGTGGVGATFTTTGSLTTLDGVTLVGGGTQRVIIKDQTAQLQNGIYVVTSVGATTVFTRAIDANSSASIDNATLYVTTGTVNGGTAWTQTAQNPTIGTNPITFVQTAGTGGNSVVTFQTSLSGLTPSSATSGAVTLSGTLGATSGGTGTTTAPTAGQLLVGVTGGTYTPFTVTTGTGISTTTGSGTFQINNTGVTSIAGTAGNITLSAATGSVTVNLATAGTAGTYGVVTTDTFGRVTSGTVIAGFANGGTNAALTASAGSIIYNNGTSLANSTVGTSGYYLTSGGAGAPTWSNPATSLVTSFQTSMSGLTPSTATTGAVTLAGTLGVANGGTALTATPTNGQLLIGNGTNYTLGTLSVSGTSIYVTNGAGTITLAGPKYWSESTTAPGTAPSATANQSVAIGSTAAATIYGTTVFANGDFATAGDAQNVTAVLRYSTTVAGAQELFLDGAGGAQRLVLPNNSAWTYTINVVARRTDATGTYGAWSFQGLIYKDATAASTTVSGNSKTTIARIGNISGASNDPTVTADTTNGSLKVSVTGYASNTIRWVATVQLAQVTN